MKPEALNLWCILLTKVKKGYISTFVPAIIYLFASKENRFSYFIHNTNVTHYPPTRFDACTYIYGLTHNIEVEQEAFTNHVNITRQAGFPHVTSG